MSLVTERFLDDLRRHRAGNLVVVTGAGMSLASGIPTFRGTDKGAIWKADVTELGTFRFFQHDPVESWRWYQARFEGLDGKLPNAGHKALVEIETWQRERGKFLLVTQNIDTLHEQAESSDFVKVHGSSDKIRCPEPKCEHGGKTGSLVKSEFDLETFRSNPSLETVPKCPACGSCLRQHVLWFDEYYQSHRDYQWGRVQDAMMKMDLLVFAGTSFSVGVTAAFIDAGAHRRVPMYSINPAKEMQPHPAVQCIEAKVEELLPEVVAQL